MPTATELGLSRIMTVKMTNTPPGEAKLSNPYDSSADNKSVLGRQDGKDPRPEIPGGISSKSNTSYLKQAETSKTLPGANKYVPDVDGRRANFAFCLKPGKYPRTKQQQSAYKKARKKDVEKAKLQDLKRLTIGNLDGEFSAQDIAGIIKKKEEVTAAYKAYIEHKNVK